MQEFYGDNHCSCTIIEMKIIERESNSNVSLFQVVSFVNPIVSTIGLLMTCLQKSVYNIVWDVGTKILLEPGDDLNDFPSEAQKLVLSQCWWKYEGMAPNSQLFISNVQLIYQCNSSLLEGSSFTRTVYLHLQDHFSQLPSFVKQKLENM